MKAMVLEAYNSPLVLKDLPTPIPGPREVLIKVDACGAGLTLHHSLRGTNKAPLPAIVGHEVAGEVVGLGPGAEGVAVGDKVTLYCILTCGRCRFCLTGRESICEASPGMIGHVTPGGFAEFIKVPDRNVVKLPPALVERYDPVSTSFVCDAITTPFKAGRRARLAPLENLVVIGAAGGVGIHMIDVGRMMGARVIGVDRGATKMKAIADLGAHDGIDAGRENVPDAVRKLTGGKGADVVIDFVGAKETVEVGIAALRHGGRLVIIGLTAGAAPSFVAASVMRQEHEILGSRGFTRQEVMDTLDLVARGTLRPIVNHTFPLAEANDANGLVTQEGNIGRVVLTMT